MITVKHADGTVENAQGTLHLDGKIDVAGRVDDIQPLSEPVRRGGSRRDGDASFLLLLHPVHSRSAVVHFADFMRLAGIEQDALGRRRLTGVDMGHDPEVSVVFDLVAAGHREIL